MVRLNSYEILAKYSNDYLLFNDTKFVNDIMWKTAMEQCNNPKGMFAEGCALLLKLIFNKCLQVFNKTSEVDDPLLMKLNFNKLILEMIKERLLRF